MIPSSSDSQNTPPFQPTQESWFPQMMNLLPAAVFTCDREGRIGYFNARAAELWGRTPTPGDPLDRYCGALRLFTLDGSPLPHDQSPTARTLRTGQVMRQSELIIEQPDGRRVYVSVSVEPLLHNGEQVGAINVFHDISERVQLEAHDRFLIGIGDHLLRAAGEVEAIQAVVQAVGRYLDVDRCMLVETGLPGRQVFVHPAYQRPDGDQDRIVHGSPPMPAYLNPQDFPRGVIERMAAGQQMMITDTQTDPRTTALYETTYRALGIRAYVHTPALQDGRLMGMLSVQSSRPRQWNDTDLRLLQSVTDLLWLTLEKLRQQAQLRRSEQRLQLSLQNSGMTVFTLNRDLRFTWVANPNTGLSVEEYLGRRLSDLLPTRKDAQEIEDLLCQVMQQQTTLNREIAIQTAQQTVYFDLTAEPIFENGQVTGVLASGLNITARHHSEAELRDYARRLERSNKDLEEFAFIASHDLKEPLRKVQSFSRLLAEEGRDRLDEKNRRFLEIIVSAAERMQRMIDDLLTYSRVGTRTPQWQAVDLNEVAAEVVQDLDALLTRTGGQVQPGPLVTLQADRLQMQQLLQNLIGNGLKYHRPDTPPLVRVWCQPAGKNQIELHVSDNGIGFDMRHIDRIFLPFTRLHGRSEFEGSGIGLAICRKIAERHGGSITARSQPGEGSEFVVLLNLEQDLSHD